MQRISEDELDMLHRKRLATLAECHMRDWIAAERAHTKQLEAENERMRILLGEWDTKKVAGSTRYGDEGESGDESESS